MLKKISRRFLIESSHFDCLLMVFRWYSKYLSVCICVVRACACLHACLVQTVCVYDQQTCAGTVYCLQSLCSCAKMFQQVECFCMRDTWRAPHLSEIHKRQLFLACPECPLFFYTIVWWKHIRPSEELY